MSSSSGGSNAHDADESSVETGRSTVVNTWRIVKPKTFFLLKGGGNVEDDGQHIQLGMDTRFQCVYMGLARLLGLRPSDIRLYYAGRLHEPNDTPFRCGFIKDDIVHVYEKDCITPIIVKPPSVPSQDPRVAFSVRSCQTIEALNHYNLPLSTTVQSLYEMWALLKGGDPRQVTMYLDHMNLPLFETLGHAGLYDGSYLFGAIGPLTKSD